MGQQKIVEAKRKLFLDKWIGKGLLGWMIRVLYRVYNFTFDYSPHFLPFLIFAFKFAEWWYSDNGAGGQTKPVPPPPRPPKVSEHGISLPSDKTLCPICVDTRVNPAALSCSGFVFCYKCIHEYITEHSRCPVTLLPASLEQIRKVYEST